MNSSCGTAAHLQSLLLSWGNLDLFDSYLLSVNSSVYGDNVYAKVSFCSVQGRPVGFLKELKGRRTQKQVSKQIIRIIANCDNGVFHELSEGPCGSCTVSRGVRDVR